MTVWPLFPQTFSSRCSRVTVNTSNLSAVHTWKSKQLFLLSYLYLILARLFHYFSKTCIPKCSFLSTKSKCRTSNTSTDCAECSNEIRFFLLKSSVCSNTNWTIVFFFTFGSRFEALEYRTSSLLLQETCRVRQCTEPHSEKVFL